MVKSFLIIILTLKLSFDYTSSFRDNSPVKLMISGNRRYFTDENGNPFFWLGDRYREKSNIIWLNGGDIRGDDSTDNAFIYTYNGRNFKVNMGKISGDRVKASWYSPRNGEIMKTGSLL